INSTTGYHLRWPKKNSTHCPGWVDHYREGAARRAGNRKGPALEEQTRNWAKKKPLKFTRKIRGLSFAFGGAGGI
ncbi:hypothetical protein ACSETW_28985, partial [Pseudomonas aeruginosa]|uniref:hypothetical protein n=1 Tax=Pseudomonas aeruginosa TaxID=287 RepID=UPI00300C6DC6